MIRFVHKGDFKPTEDFLKRAASHHSIDYILTQYGQIGVQALSSATPVDSGKTAASWNYTIEHADGRTSIVWTNSNVNNHVNIAVILQTGHGTRTGGWVEGRDYISPALEPIFDKIAENAWREVTK